MTQTHRRWSTAVVATLVLAAAVGCTETRTYSFSVRNDLDRPVRVCLTKSSGPAELDWESPEQAAGPANPASYDEPPGFVLPPGRVGSEYNVPGEFYRDRGFAVLRIYLGTPSLAKMLAVDRGSPDRADYPLHVGNNNLAIVMGDQGQVRVVRAGPTPRPAAPQ